MQEQVITSNVRKVIPTLDEAMEAVRGLSEEIQALVTVPVGPHAVFSHLTYVIERLRDVRMILVRLGQQRLELTKVNVAESRFRPRSGSHITEEQARLLARHDELIQLMKLDLESLYVFGNLALDQWAYVIAYLIGLPEPEKTNFHQLTMLVQSKDSTGSLSNFKARHLKDALWLYYQIRSYRNIFIEHVRRPWQRGQTMGVFGEDFNLFIPTPPGWLQGVDIGARVQQEILPLAPKWLRRKPDDYWEKERPGRVLEITFEHIDEIPDQADRQRVWDLWKDVGGSTVSFHRLAERFVRFMSESPATVQESIKSNPSLINLGSP